MTDAPIRARVQLLIDTDPGADDALAILLALRTPGVDVVALNTVAGNVDVDRATRNALIVLEAAGRAEIPVHRGAAVPLSAEPVEPATGFHGEDGLGGQGFEPRGRAHDDPALDATLALLRDRGPDLTWVVLGPLTNVAHALRADPDACRHVRRLVVMGGTGDGVGNVTPAAEFNFWADPEAARVVLHAGLPLYLVGWDVSRRDARIGPTELEQLRASGDPVAAFALAVTTRYREACAAIGGGALDDSLDLPDPVAMAAALELERATWRRIAGDVELQGELTRGALVLDHWGTTGIEPNIELCTGFDPEHFRSVLVQRLTTASA